MPRIIVVVLAAFTLAACSAQPPEVSVNDQVPADQRTEAGSASEAAGGDGASNEPTWVAVDIDFESAPETLPAGETEITLANQGSVEHNVTIEGETIVTAGPGATESGSMTLEPGTYEYICSIPGHEQAMSGEFTVE